MTNVGYEPRDRFEAVVQLVGQPMLGFARRRADAETAQDVVSDALLVVWRRLDEVPLGGEIPWAVAVTRHCLANARRSARRQRSLVSRIARLSPPTDAQEPVWDGDAGVHEALAQLGAEDRELLRLWAWDDLRPAEIAVVLDVSAETVSVRLHRAKKRLAALLLESPADRTGPGQTPDATRNVRKRTS